MDELSGIAGMSANPEGPASDGLTYSYRPSLVGAPWEFRLGEHGIDWSAGAKSGHLPYAGVRRVRMSFRPGNMQLYRFVTEVWGQGAPRLVLASTSWKSMVEHERLDRRYAAFVAELHRRLAQTAPPARYEQGSYPLRYWPGIVVFIAVSLGLAALIARALQAHAVGGTALIVAFLALFLWQGGDYFRRNRPRRYRPDALPAELMPKA
jgi:hypothetical protein